MKEIKQLIEFIKFTHEIRTIERAIILEENVHENDAEHGYQLAMVAWYIIDKDNLKLDKFRAACVAMAHDIIEVYAGDTMAFVSSQKLIKAKEKETAAVQKIKQDWPDFTSLHELIDEYENLSSEEAKFVYALDKLVPIINNYLYGAGAWKEHRITFKQMKSIKIGKIDKNVKVNEYYGQLLSILEKHPELFGGKKRSEP